jgi:hypothetical protein
VIGRASILQVKEWMGHADVDATMQYLHYAPRSEDAALIAEAFRPNLRTDAPSIPSRTERRPVDGRARGLWL